MNALIKGGLGLLQNIKGYLLTGAVCLAAGLAGGGLLGTALKNGQIERIERNHAEEQTRAVRAALAQVQDQARVTTRSGQAAAENQARLETRYRILRQKVPVYVTRKADADLAVPLGAVVLLDAAARGDDPDGVSFAAGQSYDTASELTLAQLIDSIVANYGLANANAQQLSDLQDWIRQQEALAR